MIIRLDGVAYLPRPEEESGHWTVPEQCTLRLDFDPRRPIGAARLTRQPDGSIHAVAECPDATLELLVHLLVRPVFAVGVINPDDPGHAQIVTLGAVAANENPEMPRYRMAVEDADDRQMRTISQLLRRDVDAIDLTAYPQQAVRLLDPLLNLIGRRGAPTRCSIHPKRWIDPGGCSACRTVKRERVARRDWAARVAVELNTALAAAAEGRAWSWDSTRPKLLARRAPINTDWCGLQLVDRHDVPHFLCCERATHTGACSDFDCAATFDGTTYRAERGTHYAR